MVEQLSTAAGQGLTDSSSSNILNELKFPDLTDREGIEVRKGVNIIFVGPDTLPEFHEGHDRPHECRDLKLNPASGQVSAVYSVEFHVPAILPGPENFQNLYFVRYTNGASDYQVCSVVRVEQQDRLPIAVSQAGDKFAYAVNDAGEEALKIVSDDMTFFHQPIPLNSICEEFGGISDIDFAPNGSFILAINAHAGLHIFKLDEPDGKEIAIVAPGYHKLIVPEDPFNTVRFSQDGKVLLLTSSKYSLEFDVEIDGQKMVLKHRQVNSR